MGAGTPLKMGCCATTLGPDGPAEYEGKKYWSSLQGGPKSMWSRTEEQVFAASETHFRPTDLAAVAIVKSKLDYLTHREEPAASGKWVAFCEVCETEADGTEESQHWNLFLDGVQPADGSAPDGKMKVTKAVKRPSAEHQEPKTH